MPNIPLGTARATPEVSIIIPIEDQGSDLDVSLARFAGDPDFDSAEFVFVASRSTNEGLTRRLARQMEFYGLSGSLVLSTEPIGYFEALDLGAREARADMLLFLSQSVLPDNTGWLSPLIAELKRQPFAAAASPTLLYEDHSIRYAGAGTNAIPGLEDRSASSFAGYPRHWLADEETTAAESLAAECCLIRRDRYLTAKGFSREFVGNDFSAADLSLRLGEAGLTCLWIPTVTLYALDPEEATEPRDYWTKPARRVDAWRFRAKWGMSASQPDREGRAP
jgi:GT2 family glycosyltransferase